MLLKMKVIKKMNNFIILGLRRSGTSILRQCLLESPSIKNIEFEPHELLHAASVLKIKRYKKNKFYNNVIENFKKAKSYGVKLALNPGIDALDWIWLTKYLPNAKFIFIKRNVDSNYKSYVNNDKNTVRGIIDKDPYYNLHARIIKTFEDFNNNNNNSEIINYEDMLNNADKVLDPIFKLLDAIPPNNLKSMIRKPKF